MRLLREILAILLAACVGVGSVIVFFAVTTLTIGYGTGGWYFAVLSLTIMTFWPFVGTTTVTRCLSLLFRRGKSWRHSLAIGLALTTALLVLQELIFTFNRDWGSVGYIVLALLGAGVSAVSVTLINNAFARRARR
jgi:hypothetical protein